MKFKTFAQQVKVAQLCPSLCDPMDFIAHEIFQARILGSLSLLQEIFPTQGLNPGLPNCRWILYQLSHKGSPMLLTVKIKCHPTYNTDDRERDEF